MFPGDFAFPGCLGSSGKWVALLNHQPDKGARPSAENREPNRACLFCSLTGLQALQGNLFSPF